MSEGYKPLFEKEEVVREWRAPRIKSGARNTPVERLCNICNFHWPSITFYGRGDLFYRPKRGK